VIKREVVGGMSPIARKENNSVTTLNMGIASDEEMKARTMAVARGTRRIAADERTCLER
jgi:predicted transcriptional regulator